MRSSAVRPMLVDDVHACRRRQRFAFPGSVEDLAKSSARFGAFYGRDIPFHLVAAEPLQAELQEWMNQPIAISNRDSGGRDP